MKKVVKNTQTVSIKELMSHITTDMYTRQTLVSLFRCFLETIIEGNYSSVILVKIDETKDFQGLISRLKYSGSKVFSYTDKIVSDNFNNVQLSGTWLDNDQFLIIIADRFSCCLYWDETGADVFGLSQGFVSLNPQDALQISDYLQEIKFDQELSESLEIIKKDRRHNDKFTTILRKVVSSLENKQRDLICANKELKTLYEKPSQVDDNVSVDQFCSTIAHELRNPLGIIDLYAKVIVKSVEKLSSCSDLEKSQKSLVNAASSISLASKTLENILTELVNFSKPISVEKQAYNLKDFIDEEIMLVKPLFDNKNVNLKLDFLVQDDVLVSFDKYKINQVLLNVIKNALEVSNEYCSVEITVEDDLNNNNLVINVKDQGPGILPQNIEKIFIPYFTTKKDGTGLGLAQSKKIMEAHGGTLIVQSTGPNGTTFSLTLPVN